MGLNPIGHPEWPKQTAELVERVVGTVRSKTTDKLVTIVRAVVYGLLIAVAATVGLILVLILLTRGLQWVVALLHVGDRPRHARAVWISYLFLGVVFIAGGLLFMSKRHPTPES